MEVNLKQPTPWDFDKRDNNKLTNQFYSIPFTMTIHYIRKKLLLLLLSGAQECYEMQCSKPLGIRDIIDRNKANGTARLLNCTLELPTISNFHAQRSPHTFKQTGIIFQIACKAYFGGVILYVFTESASKMRIFHWASIERTNQKIFIAIRNISQMECFMIVSDGFNAQTVLSRL